MAEEIEAEGKLVLESKRVSKNGKRFQVWRAGEQSFTVFDGKEKALEAKQNEYVKIKLIHDGKFVRYEEGGIWNTTPITNKQRMIESKPTLAEDAKTYRECLSYAEDLLKEFNPITKPAITDVLSVTRDLFIYRKQKE